MQRAHFRSPGIGVRKIRLARFAAWASLAAILAFTAAVPWAIFMTMYGIVGAVGILIGLYVAGHSPPPDRLMLAGTVEADHEGIAVLTDAGLSRIPRADVRGGWIDAFRGDTRVVIQRNNDDRVWIRVKDREEARALLRAAGFAAEQHTFEARLVSVAAERLTHFARVGIILAVVYGVPLAALLGAAAVQGRHFGLTALAIGAVVIAPVLWVIARYGTARTAKVGTDGVTVKGIVGRRFVPFADVSAVRADDRGVWLERHGGADVLLPTSPRVKKKPLVPGALPSADAEVLLDRIREAMAAGRGEAETAARFGALDRRGRALDAWKRDLRAMVERSGASQGYRQVFLEQDELAGLLESPSAPPERRIAAALALSAAGDEATRTRLRFAVDTCANEELRVVLEHAAEGELAEEELTQAVRTERA